MSLGIRRILAVSSLAALAALGAGADDVVVQLGAGDDFVIQDSTLSERVRVDESGNVSKDAQRFLHASGTDAVFAGADAGSLTASGSDNAALGHAALTALTSGSGNSAVGESALATTSSGSDNSGFGASALSQLASGGSNLALGAQAGNSLTSGSNNIYLGHSGAASESGQIRIGSSGTHTAASIAGIHGSTSSGGLAVYVDANGALGTQVSSLRFKQAVRDMDQQSNVLMQLRPVVFRYRDELGGDSRQLQYGLLAEDVADLAPELVAYDEGGAPYGVRYHFLAPMLVNEVQKQQRLIGEQAALIAAQRSQLEALGARVERLESESGAER